MLVSTSLLDCFQHHLKHHRLKLHLGLQQAKLCSVCRFLKPLPDHVSKHSSSITPVSDQVSRSSPAHLLSSYISRIGRARSVCQSLSHTCQWSYWFPSRHLNFPLWTRVYASMTDCSDWYTSSTLIVCGINSAVLAVWAGLSCSLHKYWSRNRGTPSSRLCRQQRSRAGPQFESFTCPWAHTFGNSRLRTSYV